MDDSSQFPHGSAAVADANVARLLDRPLRDRPGGAAFVRIDEGGRTEGVVTFERLDVLVAALAGALRERGLTRGGRMLLVLPPGLDLTLAVLAAWRLGAVATHLDPGADRARIEHVAKLVDPDALVAPPRVHLLGATCPSLRGIDIAVTTGGRAVPTTVRLGTLLATPPTRHVTNPVRLAPGDLALLDAPSPADPGTGLAPRSHGSLAARSRAMRPLWPEIGVEGLLWSNLPEATFHALARGVATVLAPDPPARVDPREPRRLYRLLQRSGTTALALDASMMARLARAPGRAQLTDVTHACTGGPLVTPELLDSLRAVLPDARIATIYGTHEAGTIAIADAADVLARRPQLRGDGGLFVGHASDGVRTRIVRVVDGPLVLEPGSHLADWEMAEGTAGELLVAAAEGDAAPESPSHEVVDEAGVRWHRTRHVVRRDPDCGLWLLGRRGDGWNIAGRRMWALEIETPVTDLPEVERAAICMPKFAGTDREFKNASAVLAVQPATGFGRGDARAAAVRSLSARGLDATVEVRSLRRIPVHRDDASRVDVAALHERLKPENNEDY